MCRSAVHSSINAWQTSPGKPSRLENFLLENIIIINSISLIIIRHFIFITYWLSCSGRVWGFFFFWKNWTIFCKSSNLYSHIHMYMYVYILSPCYLFDVCSTICSDLPISFLILIICFFFPFQVLGEACQFYWHFQRISLCFISFALLFLYSNFITLL